MKRGARSHVCCGFLAKGRMLLLKWGLSQLGQLSLQMWMVANGWVAGF